MNKKIALGNDFDEKNQIFSEWTVNVYNALYENPGALEYVLNAEVSQ